MAEHTAIEQDIGQRLVRNGFRLAVAESCTGGLIGHRLTSVSGSSAYFLGGIIAYADVVKKEQLGVAETVLAESGAVSEPVARQMAVGVRDRFGADIGVSVTGIAGPTGATPGKPVGLVFVGVSGPDGCRVREFRFTGTRAEIKTSSCRAALDMLREYFQ
jgi:PncC family amidohydrolase